jgi:putative ABC transport system permease protein
MDTLLQNVRYGLRQMWRSPLFTAAAVATLALGIGANTALFTLGQALIVKPVAGVQESDGLVWVMATNRNGRPSGMSLPDHLDYRSGLSHLVELGGTTENSFALSGAGEPLRIDGQAVTGNYFALLRTPFVLGRGFTAADDSAGKPLVAVLSHGLWQRRYAGDSSIVGRTVVLNGHPTTVVGVTAQGFNGADIDTPRGVWVPFATFRVVTPAFTAWDHRGSRWLKSLGRLNPGVTREQLSPAVRTIADRIAAADTANRRGMSAAVYSAKSGMPPGAGPEIAQLTILSTVVTGLVLLIACANVSNLLLARGIGRRREIGIRLAIGASRARLVGQLLTESSLLALLSGALGVLLAYIATDWLLASGVLPLEFDVRPDVGIVAFTVGAAAFAAIVFGLVPAVEATRTDLASAVKDGTQARDPRRSRIQSSLVVAQLALSLVLLTTSGLFLRSLQKASQMQLGFEATPQVLGVSFDLALQNYSNARTTTFLNAVHDRALAIPGVQSATFTDIAPLGNRFVIGEVVVEGQRRDSAARFESTSRAVNFATVRPGYFSVMNIPLVRGRDFRPADDSVAPRMVIVSAVTARDLWPDSDPIGKRVSLTGEGGPFMTVIGVAADVMLGGPTDARNATAYVPLAQQQDRKRLTMLVRTAGEPGQLADALRRDFRALDANLPLFDVQTLAQYKRIKLRERLNGASILAAFGALALLLASIGVFSVMAFSVVQRTREIGIRIALGARSSEVVALFVKRGMRLTTLGVVIGMALSVGVSQLLQGMLFGLTATDGATFVGVAVLLTLVALAASWFPARRAAQVDPLAALRSE